MHLQVLCFAAALANALPTNGKLSFFFWIFFYVKFQISLVSRSDDGSFGRLDRVIKCPILKTMVIFFFSEMVFCGFAGISLKLVICLSFDCKDNLFQQSDESKICINHWSTIWVYFYIWLMILKNAIYFRRSFFFPFQPLFFGKF